MLEKPAMKPWPTATIVKRVSLPFEPTPEMVTAGLVAADDHVTAARIAAIWKAMFTDAPKG